MGPDDYDTSLPPPSYEEAVSTPVHTGTTTTNTAVRPAMPPPQPPPPPRPSHSSPASQSPAQSQLNDLYTANSKLPFRYPKGFFCNKCSNTGYRKRGKYCHNCWDQFYLKKHAYNPNPGLAFRYPRGFYCERCNNTGTKVSSGRTCQDCYERFAPRNNYSMMSTSGSGLLGLLDPFARTTTTFAVPAPAGAYGAPQAYGPPGGYMSGPPPPPLRVLPGDPRLGGVLCGRCRGSGLVHFFLDEEMCPVCGGMGRILNVRQ
ncbi:hypothetical protein CANTEDRAFT_92541 [Yamadazyma tenuis ATCC 10573]|uniref:Uncharacterized protein n=1 Tax=Candida tenuis (strain ATCC 10573 / BCRC 21748 / CBS 615 / JCM 9827 / NBRC 10315 / NRRL Y-1498 / VKM Y-70) TaxID=590646 RepID=G3B055_CANTC|nr:uncharacterized protein CANTEDRAFT_92541 [Yamadazyma tenuis ATCC 10573]EGV65322.1 hypothetical protein CANTEDRAFT_92541 [Yamadazyma tenuis ATCC 10573]